jgi:DNA/RNA endonuclease YhcR with UshA esterase domain
LAVLAVIAVCVLASAPSKATAQQPRVVADTQAARSVGRTVTVEGVVAQVSVSRRSNTTFLNFGRRYPNHTFTAVIFRSAANQFPNPRQWEGKRVRVTGEVRLYRGRPEIVLEEPRQLSLAP